MAVKQTVASLEEIPEPLREHYKPVEGGSGFTLVVDGAEDVTALKNALTRERETAKNAIAQAKARGEDVTALEASWGAKLADLEKNHQEQIKTTQNALRRATRDRAAVELATKLAGDASDLLLPHIEKRLKVEIDGDRPLVRVLDLDGRPSASSLTDLENELRGDKRFSRVIVTSRASGSGAGGDSKKPADGGAGQEINPNKIRDPKELAAWITSQREKRGG